MYAMKQRVDRQKAVLLVLTVIVAPQVENVAKH